MAVWIAPSILAADFAALGEEVDDVMAAGADAIHFDVMDNHYVPNLTVGPLVLRSLRSRGSRAPVDVHLMVRPVNRLIDDFLAAGADGITIHPDADEDPAGALAAIRAGGAKAGLAVNPDDSPDALAPLLDAVDTVLVMSVRPGFGGQAFMPSALENVHVARELIDASGRNIRLAIDGGINQDTVGAAAAAGADGFVAGSAVFGVPNKAPRRAEDYRRAIAALRALAAGAANRRG